MSNDDPKDSDPKRAAEPDPTVEVLGSEDADAATGQDGIVLARQVLPDRLPVMPVDQRPLFPGMMVPVVLERPELVQLMTDLLERKMKYLAIVLKRPPAEQDDEPAAAEAAHKPDPVDPSPGR